jgi:hypothetical protein
MRNIYAVSIPRTTRSQRTAGWVGCLAGTGCAACYHICMVDLIMLITVQTVDNLWAVVSAGINKLSMRSLRGGIRVTLTRNGQTVVDVVPETRPRIPLRRAATNHVASVSFFAMQDTCCSIMSLVKICSPSNRLRCARCLPSPYIECFNTMCFAVKLIGHG